MDHNYGHLPPYDPSRYGTAAAARRDRSGTEPAGSSASSSSQPPSAPSAAIGAHLRSAPLPGVSSGTLYGGGARDKGGSVRALPSGAIWGSAPTGAAAVVGDDDEGKAGIFGDLNGGPTPAEATGAIAPGATGILPPSPTQMVDGCPPRPSTKVRKSVGGGAPGLSPELLDSEGAPPRALDYEEEEDDEGASELNTSGVSVVPCRDLAGTFEKMYIEPEPSQDFSADAGGSDPGLKHEAHSFAEEDREVVEHTRNGSAGTKDNLVTPAAKIATQDGKEENNISPVGVDELDVEAIDRGEKQQLALQTGREGDGVATDYAAKSYNDGADLADGTPSGQGTFQSKAQPQDNSKGSKGGGAPQKPHPHSFTLHPSLSLDLPPPVVARVSFYSVVHDINKEAAGMAANDHSNFHRNGSGKGGLSSAGANPLEGAPGGDPPKDEERDPIVVAVNGPPPDTAEDAPKNSSYADAALVDEERWLLAAVAERGPEEGSGAPRPCPSTFAEAMGEQEAGEGPSPSADAGGNGSSAGGGQGQTANPLSSLVNSRTQLWKPSRSWWEAKSGKNPWIEPNSHNKRWRYLWPLIHYHKFLARCIKKLKRNGVDVKTSLSPVSAFLREEVCAVSDHLAAASKFTAEDWMDSLSRFSGWTDPDDPDAEANLRALVGRLGLRPLREPGDVDSPLLRDQIDSRFLRVVAAAREQMANGGGADGRGGGGGSGARGGADGRMGHGGRPPVHGGNVPPRFGYGSNGAGMPYNHPPHPNGMYGSGYGGGHGGGQGHPSHSQHTGHGYGPPPSYGAGSFPGGGYRVGGRKGRKGRRDFKDGGLRSFGDGVDGGWGRSPHWGGGGYGAPHHDPYGLPPPPTGYGGYGGQGWGIPPPSAPAPYGHHHQGPGQGYYHQGHHSVGGYPGVGGGGNYPFPGAYHDPMAGGADTWSLDGSQFSGGGFVDTHSVGGGNELYPHPSQAMSPPPPNPPGTPEHSVHGTNDSGSVAGSDHGVGPPLPPASMAPGDVMQTPYKGGTAGAAVPLSPFWGHLDQAALTGVLDTPLAGGANAGNGGNSHGKKSYGRTPGGGRRSDGKTIGGGSNGHLGPLLINPYAAAAPAAAGGHVYAAVPPSPATQFLMSSQGAGGGGAGRGYPGFGGAYGGGAAYPPPPPVAESVAGVPPSTPLAPPRAERPGQEHESSVAEEDGDVTPPPAVRKVTSSSALDAEPAEPDVDAEGGPEGTPN